ncbi:hypothetical protein W02_32030 [Nitrospira sp. KM1]|nr:hypothetical protein W02_32030 [Nitrospira sp. KM1]
MTASMDDYEAEYHLTRDGWVIGSYYFFGRRLGIASVRPTGTYETWLRHATCRAEHCEENTYWSRFWKNDLFDEQELRRFRDAKGWPPDDAHLPLHDSLPCSRLLEAVEDPPSPAS